MCKWTEAPTIPAQKRAAHSDVFVSPDDGDSWQLASDGLPKVPHGADIRFGSWGGQDVALARNRFRLSAP